jgi:hypothetical protein
MKDPVWSWRLCGDLVAMGMVVVGAYSTGGCQSSAHVEYTQVELRGCLDPADRKLETPEYPVFLTSGETVKIADPYVAQEMAEYFPGLGSGRRALVTWLMGEDIEIIFTERGGRRIIVCTMEYKYWSSDVDHGSLMVKGDWRAYLRALFAKARIEKASDTAPSKGQGQ